MDLFRSWFRRSLRSGLRLGADEFGAGKPSTSADRPAALSAASFAFFASRFFLFFTAALERFSSPSAVPARLTPPPGAAPGRRSSPAASAPGTSRLRGLPNPFTPLPSDILPLLTYAAPPSSSRLKASGVTVPRAPGGRYAPAGLEGVLTVPRYAKAEA